LELHHLCNEHCLQVELQANRDFRLHAARDFHLRKNFILVEELLAVHDFHLQADCQAVRNEHVQHQHYLDCLVCMPSNC
jgi:hypothetical protein